MPFATTSTLNVVNADKYKLYTRAFQAPRADVQFCERIFQQCVGRSAVSLREDFCGTAAVSCEWIQRSENRHAIAIDIEAEPLAWCRENLLPAHIPQTRPRLQLIHADVLTLPASPVDIILALNSSFCTFKERKQLLNYFRRCHHSLKEDGILVLGLYAGPEAQMVGVDQIPCDGFVAVWEQSEFNAVTNESLNRIHFRFPDGSSLRNAFVYDYRMWTPRELTEALLESGYRQACVYSRSDVCDADGRIEECNHACVSTYWDALVVGFK